MGLAAEDHVSALRKVHGAFLSALPSYLRVNLSRLHHEQCVLHDALEVVGHRTWLATQ